VLTIVDNGDGSYNWQFSEPVNVVGTETSEPSLVMYSATYAYTASPNSGAQVSADVVQFYDANLFTGNNTGSVIAQPATLTSVSGNPFALQLGIAIT
jgi:hypothetical protein